MKKKRLNFSIMKKIIILFFVLQSCFSYSQCLKVLVEDLAKNSKEFKTLVNEKSGFKAWQVLAENAPTLRTDISELSLVSQNLEAIEKAGGYTKWKSLQSGGKIEKLWTKIDEHDGDFHGNHATYYDVNVTYQAYREQVGVAFSNNNILEFHLNIPEKLQGQGIGSVIFKQAIEDYAPSKVKGWWKSSDIYTGNESINLTIFKQKLQDGLSAELAVFETPTGKILKANNFDGNVEVIKNTPNEVIIYFNPKM